MSLVQQVRVVIIVVVDRFLLLESKGRIRLVSGAEVLIQVDLVGPDLPGVAARRVDGDQVAVIALQGSSASLRLGL